MVVRIEREDPLKGCGGVFEALQAELRQAELVEVTRRVMGVEAHRTLEQVQRLARLAGEAERVRQRDVTVRIVGIAGDPNDADGYVALADAFSFTGKAREALDLLERAMRLNPHYPPRYLYQLGLAQFGLQRLEDAAASLQRVLTLNPDDHWAQRLLLAVYGLLGRRTEASRLLEAVRERDKRGRIFFYDPLTVRAISYWYPFAYQQDAGRFAEGLRNAGVPE